MSAPEGDERQEDFSSESYKPRLQRQRLVKMFGEAAAAEYLRRREQWRRGWGKKPAPDSCQGSGQSCETT